MRTRLALATLPLLALPLTACGGGAKSASSSHPAASDRKAAGEKAYDDWVSEKIPDSVVGKADKAGRLKVGRSLCDDLSGGGDWAAAVKVSMDDGHLSASDAGGYVAATFDALCPENLDKLPK